MTIALKTNVPGYVDELGRFRPIRSASFVGSGASRRPAKVKDRKKYSKAKAGDLGKVKQERALEDPWDREIRLEREAKAKRDRENARIEKQIAAEIYGETSGRTSSGKALSLAQFVRSEGGIRRAFRHGGKAARGKRSEWDKGEVDRLTLKELGTTGLTTSDPRRGKTLDGMYQAAREAGYDVADIDDLLSRIEDEISTGKKTYSTHGYMAYNPDTLSGKNPIRVLKHKFYVGQKLATRFIGDHDLILRGEVVSRTPKFVTVKVEGERELKRCGVRVWRDSEIIYPLGKYSMAPTFWASEGNKAERKNNPDLLSMFANAAVGVASTLQINEMVKRKSRRKNPLSGEGKGSVAAARLLFSKKLAEIRKYPEKHLIESAYSLIGYITASTAGEAALRKRIKVAVAAGLKWSSASGGRAKLANPKPDRDKRGDLYVLTIGSGDDLISVYLHDGDKDGFSKRFKTMAAARAYATRNKIKIVENPAPAAVKANGFIKRAWARSRAKAEYGRELRLASAAERARKRRSQYESDARSNPKGAPKKAPARRNPKTTARRPTYEMFQGRKATTAKPMIVSNHAPARLDQLGDLIELKIAGGQTLKFNGGPKLCAAGGKLWIAGKRFAKADPTAKANEINPIGEIDHVVYGTHKPHHGDHAYTHYIHKLGEESGKRPILCVDRDGFPVIRGGNYTIEARGIVD